MSRMYCGFVVPLFFRTWMHGHAYTVPEAFDDAHYWSVHSIVSQRMSETSERGAAGVWDALWSVSSFSLFLLFSSAGQAAVYRITCGGGNWVQRFGFRTARVRSLWGNWQQRSSRDGTASRNSCSNSPAVINEGHGHWLIKTCLHVIKRFF